MSLREMFDPDHGATPIIGENRLRHMALAQWIAETVADKDQAIRDHMRTACFKFLLTSCRNLEDYLATLPPLAAAPEPEPILPGPDLSPERMASFELDDEPLPIDSPAVARGKKRK